MKITNVAFLGYADAKPGDPEYDAAQKTAELLARGGYVIVDGGGPGVMKAATDGAHAGGGKAVGITYYPESREENFEGRDPQNLFDEEVTTDTYVERTLRIMSYADVYIIFNGGTGTISEFGMAWGLARIHFGHHKPLVLFGDFWHDIIEALGKSMRLRPEELQVYHIVTTPEEAVIKIKSLEASN